MLSVVWIIFAVTMVAAAVVDLISYRIPNALVLGLFVLFLIVAGVNWSEVEWLGHFAAATVIFGAGIVFYAIRQMGAGDVKLLGVAALWAGVNALPALMLFISLFGLAGMLVIIILRLVVPRLQTIGASGQKTLPRVLTKGQGIPYGIGIGPGAIIASFSFAPWLWGF